MEEAEARRNSLNEKIKTLRENARKALSTFEAKKYSAEDLDIHEAIEELNIYHIELEMQVEELRNQQFIVEENRRYLSRLFNYAPLGYVVLDTTGVIRDINRTAATYFKKNKTLLQGEKLQAYLPADQFIEYRRCLRALHSLRYPQRLEIQFRDAHHIKFWTRLDLSLLETTSEDEEELILCSLLDIGREKEYEQTLVDQRRQLERQTGELQKKNASLEQVRKELASQKQELELTSRYKTEFLANMTHELRTPLNSIIVLSQMMARNERGELNGTVVKRATVIHEAGQELLRLINDVLDISKIEAGKIKVEAAPFHSGDLKIELEEYFSPIARKQHISFRIQDEWNRSLTSDRNKVSQILRNLVANAIKFTRQGAVMIRFDDSGPPERPLRFIVTDTGIGIPEDRQQTIFEAFRQVDGSISREFGGTGLGLSIALKLAQLVEGEILLESQPARGSEFTLLLPPTIRAEEELSGAAQTDAPEGEEAGGDRTPLSGLEREDEPVIPQLRNRKVLIVDDDIRTIFALAAALEPHGVEILDAADGRQALAVLEETTVDIILLDMMMPVMDGYDFLREIRSERPAGPGRIPVVAVTARAGARDGDICLRAGADACIIKPIHYPDLLKTMARLLTPPV